MNGQGWRYVGIAAEVLAVIGVAAILVAWSRGQFGESFRIDRMFP